MLRTLLVTVFSLIVISQSNAQVRATTESGNKVLLFDDGTWRYEEKTIASDQNTAPVAPAAVAAAAVAIDASKVAESKPADLFFLPSPRLERYFGDKAGNIRCKLGCSNNQGVVKVHFIWEFPVSDGNRYFGWFKETDVIITMMDGQELTLVSSEESSIKRYEKSSYSAISNTSIALSPEQIAILSSQPMKKMEVGWRKKPETYDLDQSRLLMEALREVL